MQFEHFDRKVREAADQHHPDYDDHAWVKMKKLLDQHLPVKDKRWRRFIIFLFLFAFLAGGVWVLIFKPWQQRDDNLTAGNRQERSVIKPDDEMQMSTEKEKSVKDKGQQQQIPGPVTDNPIAVDGKKDDQSINPVSTTGKRNDKTADVKSLQKKNDNKTGRASKSRLSNPDQFLIEAVNPATAKKDKNAAGDISVRQPVSNDLKGDEIKTDNVINRSEAESKVVSPSGTEEQIKNEVKSEEKTISKNIAKPKSSKKKQALFFIVAAGADISSVGLKSPGKPKSVLGAGLGYSFNKRITVRTGFFSGTKVYSAGKEDYKPANPPPNPAYLQRIDADCNVYEIPLSIVYNFGQSEKQNFFASAGLSSYFMKKEVYHYLYKYPGNPNLYVYKKEIKNENEHYFSVLTLSGGFQRKISKAFSLAAEPYIKFPLSGVGYGNVKLNNAGILFSVNVSPFQTGTKK